MWKKIAVAGGTLALIGGLGTAALAESGSTSSPSAKASDSAGDNGNSQATHHRKGRGFDKLKNFEHGTWVSRKDNADVTHTAYRGKASNVTATSITVTAVDNASQSFVVNTGTKVHTRAQHKGAAIQAVQNGDTVFVSGTGTNPVTANQVIDTSR